jgi:hypothetical protein
MQQASMQVDDFVLTSLSECFFNHIFSLYSCSYYADSTKDVLVNIFGI